MKNGIKTVLVVLCALLLFTGCSCAINDNKPDEAVETFFEKYRAKDDNIITQLKETIENEVSKANGKTIRPVRLRNKRY